MAPTPTIKSGDYIELDIEYKGTRQYWCGSVRTVSSRPGIILLYPTAYYEMEGRRWVQRDTLPRHQGFKKETAAKCLAYREAMK